MRSPTAPILLAIGLLCGCPTIPIEPRDAAPPDATAPDAHPEADGWPLELWAPGVDQVQVLVEGEEPQPLSPIEDGLWTGRAPGLEPGGRYRFELIAGGETLERIDPRALGLSRDDGSSVLIVPDFEWDEVEADFTRPSLRDAVIYELHVGTFNAPESGGGGTFDSVVEGLDHLVDLGVTVVELMPVQEFPGDRSWGYNSSLPFVVERSYGGAQGLATLVGEAHRRGLAVLLDVVYNHLDQSTPLCSFTSADDHCGEPYFYSDERGLTDWGPRPDFSAPQVRQYIRDNVFLWMERFHIDGFRWDSTSNIWNTEHGQGADLPEGRELLAWVNGQIDDLGDGRISIAEDFNGGAPVTRPSGDLSDPDHPGLGFDAQWDGWFHWEIHRFAVDDEGELDALAEALRFSHDGDPFRRVIYTESHDTTGRLNDHLRLPEEIDPDDPGSWTARKRSTMVAALMFTTPALPMLLQGQEMLQAGAFHDTEPLDWSNLDRFGGILSLYRDLIALRRDLGDRTAGLRGPNIVVSRLDEVRGVLVYRRWDHGGPGDDVVVIANLSDETLEGYQVGFPSRGTWWVRFNGDSPRYGDDFTGRGPAEVEATPSPRDGLPCSAALDLAPFTVLVLSQDP